MNKQNLTTEMNTQLANWNVLNTKLHHYHWYVTGTGFFTLHTKFEEYYTEAAGHMDEIAERILAVGGKPLSTLKSYLQHAEVSEAAGGETSEQMVKQLAEDFKTVSQGNKRVIEAAEEAGDDATADMFIAINESIQKHTWMLDAYNAQ